MELNDNIFVTGATGLVGSYIVRLLRLKGYKNISCGKRKNSKYTFVEDFKNDVTWVDYDLHDLKELYDGLSEVDYLFHAAASVHFDPSKSKQLIRTNVIGTSDVVNSAITNKVKKMLFVSSIAAIGRNEKDLPITEKTEWENSDFNSIYAISKHDGELEVWRGIAEGLNAVIVNPALILGSGDWTKSSLQIYSKIKSGNTFYPAGSNGIVDVRDVAKASVIAMEKPITNERMIICAENLNYKDLMDGIAKEMNLPISSRAIKPWMGKLAVLFEKGRSLILRKPPLITKESMMSLMHKNTYDSSKSKQLLGIKYYPISQTISETTELFLQNSKEPLSF